jgi:hypothetical protein
VFGVEWLKSLPVPTAEQTARFADHVADNHSWYKHLPFFPPGASFVFFPNPHAGRGVEYDGKRFIVYDVERRDYFAQHSRLPTTEYVARFGHWDYHVDDNPRVSDPQPGPWVYSADGSQRELLPDHLKRRWSCRLTAFLKPAPPILDLRPCEFQREADAFMESGATSPGPRQSNLLSRQPNEDPAAKRYRAVVPALRHAAATRNPATVYPFFESEARAQLELVLGTLQRVRVEWASGHTASVEPAEAPGSDGV